MTGRRINWTLTATDKTAAAFASLNNRVSGVAAGFARINSAFGAFAAVAAGGAFGRIVIGALEAGDALDDLSKRLGISAERLQGLQYAAAQNGATAEKLNVGFTRLARSTYDAERGLKEQADAFAELNINIREFSSLDLDERFQVLAEQISKVPSEARQLSLATMLLGRGAAELLPLLQGGAAGLTKLRAEIVATNTVLSNEQVRVLGDAADWWGKAKTEAGNYGKILLSEVIPWLIVAKNKMVDLQSGDLTGATRIDRELRLHKAAIEKFRKDNPDLWELSPEQRAATDPGIAAVDARVLSGLSVATDAIAAEYKARADAIAAVQAKIVADQAAANAEIAGLFSSTREPIEAFGAELKRLAVLSDEYGMSADVVSRAQRQAAERFRSAQQAMFDASASGERWNEAQREAARIMDETRTPWELYISAIERVNELESMGALGIEHATRARSSALDAYYDAVRDVNDELGVLSDSTENLFRDLEAAANGFARNMTDVLFDATNDIGEMFRKLALEIAKALVTNTVTQPLVNSILAAFSPGRALGGAVTGGSSYVVGERGPEVFVPQASGSIVPAGSSGHVNISFNVNSLDPRDAANVIIANKHAIIGVVRQSIQRAGGRPVMA